MYERILLPTDGSPAMGAPVEHGIGQAVAHGATVHALYVVDVRAYVMLPEETAGRVAALLQEAGAEAIDAVRDRVEAADADLDFVGQVVTGVPPDAIVAYADEHDIDLIVMGTQGRTGDENRLLGSVAEAVVRSAEVPVLTVRMGAAELPAEEATVPEEQQRYVG